MKQELPEYTDGCLELFILESVNMDGSDYSIEKLKSCEMKICYREISVFDHTRYDFNQGGIDITLKIRIPRYNGVTSKHFCKINDVMHEVYNATHVRDKNGFQETEITLKKPVREYEVIKS